MSGSSGRAAFLITRHYNSGGKVAPDPQDVRGHVRGSKYDTVAQALAPIASVDQSRGTLVIPDDSSLLMIGKTEELIGAWAEALNKQRVLMIEIKSGKPLECQFVRIRVSPIQVDTLLAIFAQGQWPWPNPQSSSWRAPDLGNWRSPSPPKGSLPRDKPSYISVVQSNDGDERQIKNILESCRNEFRGGSPGYEKYLTL